MEINVAKLHEELEQAGFNISGCDANGRVLDLNGDEIQNDMEVKAVIDAHDPAPDDAVILRGKYYKAGITSEDMLFALWLKFMQEDSTDADSIQGKMDDVNLSVNP